MVEAECILLIIGNGVCFNIVLCCYFSCVPGSFKLDWCHQRCLTEHQASLGVTRGPDAGITGEIKS